MSATMWGIKIILYYRPLCYNFKYLRINFFFPYIENSLY